jgi:hypothetical protein
MPLDKNLMDELIQRLLYVPGFENRVKDLLERHPVPEARRHQPIPINPNLISKKLVKH